MTFDKYLVVSGVLALTGSVALADDWSTARPDGHAPIGVMGDHTHNQGEWMISYRYMHMEMDGNRSGTDDISLSEVLARWPVTPTKMTMDMHMLGLMYAPVDRLTLVAMMPYQFSSMDHVTRTGVRFTTETDGIGDLGLTGLYRLGQIDHHSFHINAGISLPTGSTDERDTTPAGPSQRLPYPMQLGSGTFDLMPGITYLGQTKQWSWGSQFRSSIRLDDNDEGYALGDRFALSGWLARKLCNVASLSLRLDGQTWGDIDGADRRLNPAVVPTADPRRRAGTRLDLLAGLNIFAPKGLLKGHRIAIEGGLPIYQHLDGPQLEMDWITTVGWQYSW